MRSDRSLPLLGMLAVVTGERVQFTAGHSLDDFAAVIVAELGVPSAGKTSVVQNGGQSHARQQE